MTKTNQIQPGQITPQATGLNEAEAQKLQRQPKKLSAEDAARIAQQAGYVRGKQKKRGIDIGDSSHAPIPLPDDDADADADVWSQERLNEAQESLMLASAQMSELAKNGSLETSFAETVAGSSFLPTEEGVIDLENLSKRPAPEPIPLEEVTTNVERLFHIHLGDEVSVGHKVLATGLVVAGEGESVHVEKGGINEQRLVNGVQRVTERSNQAVGEAQRMSKGINKEINLQRTFVFKR